MKIMKNVKHFSHDDIDGVGCVVMAKSIYLHTTETICDYDSIDQEIMVFIQTYLNTDGSIKETCPYDMILLTDLAISEPTAIALEQFSKLTNTELKLIDHHETALHLNEFEWAHVMTEYSGKKTSSTSEFYRLLVRTEPSLTTLHIRNVKIKEFAEQIRLYDTWEWKRNSSDLTPRMLNELYLIIGNRKFIERFTNDMSIEFTESEKYLLEIEMERINAYIQSKENQMIITRIHGYRAGVVFADRNMSVIGNGICQRNRNLDFVCIIHLGRNKVSIRTIKDNIDTGEILKRIYNGGGHPKAAGFIMKKFTKQDITKLIFDGNVSLNL